MLLLSTSESIANHPELFRALDRKWKIYQAKHLTPGISVSSASPSRLPAAPEHRSTIPVSTTVMTKTRINTIAELSHRALLVSYAPASVTTDPNGNVLYIHGDTGRYLRPAPGPASNNILDMARDGLLHELRTAIAGAATAGTPTLNHPVSIKSDGGSSDTTFSVRRLAGQTLDESDFLLMISFEEAASPGKVVAKPRRGKRAASAGAEQVAQLERDLAFAKESLQSNIEELQATNEELKSANEELQSTNEELQSSNEELETSKEEMQSLNEEMVTVNAEQNARIEQLSDLQNDMKNLLDATNIGTIFLDHHLRIRRFTREAAKAYRLVATDVGRALGDIKSNLAGDDLMSQLQSVLDTLIPCEKEVQMTDGAFYLARMQPYRTLDNVIEGVVLTFTDITSSREARQTQLDRAQLARTLAEDITNTIGQPLVVLDAGLKVMSANSTFYRHCRVTPPETVGRFIFDLGNGQWNIPALRQLLEKILPQQQIIEGFAVEHDFPDLGRQHMEINARRIVSAPENPPLILLAITARVKS